MSDTNDANQAPPDPEPNTSVEPGVVSDDDANAMDGLSPDGSEEADVTASEAGEAAEPTEEELAERQQAVEAGSHHGAGGNNPLP